ncbi:putative serine/threonine-protein kinase [Morus notabilis]|uniref:Putative serine/threonine-protein kinase n=1 Tax=Morus notabilis TaxID=981085 RepID=W9QIG7_9ROSA|nr:mitogen-activated protein kinase kinase kinase [Morus notabilis]EXB37972.1 putative serine/threonine-protein kinase [Morus notabilis]
MAAALECWSSRASTDEDMVEQVLMRTHDRSEGSAAESSSSSTAASAAAGTMKDSSAMQKRLQRLSRNVSEAIASLRNSLNLDSSTANARDETASSNKIESCRKVVWCSVVRNLTQLYPGSQLPEKLVSNIRKHYDSLPLSYAQAGFDMKEVFLHIKMLEQASLDDYPAILSQEVSDDEIHGSVFKLTFACNSSISWPVMSGALDSASICCKKIQIFERKGSTLGVVLLLVQAGHEKTFKARIENALKSATVRKPKPATMKFAFGLCGCQEENTRGREMGEIEEEVIGEANVRNGVENLGQKVELQMPLPTSSFVASVDEWQTIQSSDEIGKWLLNSDYLEFVDQVGPNSFKGVYKGKKVGIEKLKGCEKGNSYDFELRKDLLELMTCGHKNILQFHGVCVDENHGLCVVTKLMEGGSVFDLMLKSKKNIQTKEIIRIATDVAEGIKFMNDHGVAYRDLNTQRILLDRHGNACLGDMGIVAVCKSVGEAMEYETDGYRWLAPEIIAGDPECVTETWMSNVYSFGMVLWEMVTGEAAYSAFSPVQAAVGIAACGLRPEIPKDCPQMLRSLMTKCWNNCPSKRPQFSEILSVLLRPNNNSNNCR